MIVGKGSMIGEEDIITSSGGLYSCNVKCISQVATYYRINKDSFISLKSQDDVWLSVLEKALWKEKQKGAEHIGEKIAKA